MDQKPIDRVKIIIEDEDLAISAFEKRCGLSNNSIQTAIKRRSNLKDETLNTILNSFPRYSPGWILTGKGAKFVDKLLTERGEGQTNESFLTFSGSPAVITVDSHRQDNIVLVPQAVQAGYLQGGFAEPKFIRKLPTYRMPGLDNGIFRMFEVRGNSMFPTIPARSYVVGRFVEDWGRDIKDNHIYVIISHDMEDGLVKRCINRIDKYNNLLCKSDNRREFPSQNIDPRSIREVWEVKLHLNFTLPDPADLYDRMNDLEAELQQIKRLLN